MKQDIMIIRKHSIHRHHGHRNRPGRHALISTTNFNRSMNQQDFHEKRLTQDKQAIHSRSTRYNPSKLEIDCETNKNRKQRQHQSSQAFNRTTYLFPKLTIKAAATPTITLLLLLITVSNYQNEVDCRSTTSTSTSALFSKLPDLVSATNDEPIVATLGQDAYISCVANNLQNYTIIWRYSNDAHAPGLISDSGLAASGDGNGGSANGKNSEKLEDADAAATILTAGRQRVTSDERFTVIRSHNTWLLKISQVRMSDTGTYICQTNSEPKVRALRILTVLNKSQAAAATTNQSIANSNPNSWAPFDQIDPLSGSNERQQLPDYNFTECCKQEYVYPRCQKLCSIHQLASKYNTLNIIHECYSALPSITRCMVGGRNVVECCSRHHVPRRCQSMCGQSAEAAMSLSIQDQTYCADYSASIMSCVAEGINSLPGQPEYVIVEAVSSASLKVSWQKVTDEIELKKIDGWIINLTKLSSFEDTISTTSQQQLKPTSGTAPTTTTSDNRSSSSSSNEQQQLPKFLANLNLVDVKLDPSLKALTKIFMASTSSSSSNSNNLTKSGLASIQPTVSLKLDKQLNEFSIDNLRPYTVYQIQMFAFNREGRSQLSDPIRALTLAPENDLTAAAAAAAAKPASDKSTSGDKAATTTTSDLNDELVEPNLPDTRKCCESRGVTLRKCVDTLCDPIEADRATIEDLMICAPWSNVTFSCLSSRVDHSECCRSRGVTPFCLSMCSGEMKRLDYRHFRCLTHMSTYTNCILESHDVLPSAPQNFTVGPITSSWAVLNWRSPKRRAKTLQGYRIFWRKVDSQLLPQSSSQPLATGFVNVPAPAEINNNPETPSNSRLNEPNSAALVQLVGGSTRAPPLQSGVATTASGSAPINDDLFYMSAEAATNPYLLDALQPDTVYETFVVAVNKYGQSKSSPHFLFQTLPDQASNLNKQDPSSTTDDKLESRLPLHGLANGADQMTYYNETNCCLNSGVPSSCRQLCNYDLKVSDGYDLITSCSSQMPAIMRCLAGNRNSVPCCRTRGVSDQCLNVCAGLTEHSPLMVASQCGSDFGKILRCLDEGSKQIPSAPLDLHATDVKSDRITLAWRPSNEDKLRTDVEYHVRYQQLQTTPETTSTGSNSSETTETSGSSGGSSTATNDSDNDTKTDLSALIAVVPLHPLEHNHILSTNKTEITLDKLQPGQRYSLYVTAENSYGISLPSLILVFETPKKDSDATDEHKRNATLGPPHALEILRSDTESIVLKWSPPLYMENDSQLRYRVFYKLIGLLHSTPESTGSSSTGSNNGGSLSSSSLETESSSGSSGVSGTDSVSEVQQVGGNWTAIETSHTSIPLRNLNHYSQYAITVQAFTRNRRGHMSELLLASTAKPIPPSINPPFIINQPIEGNNITIMCVALGQPTPQISMFINGLLIQKRTQPYIVYHLVNLSRDPLTITCFASNGRGRDYASVQSRTEVSVKFPPRATAKVKEVQANLQSVARISCSITGNPQPSVVWSFVGQSAKSGSVIVPNERVTTLVVNQFDSPSAWSHTLTIRNVSKSDAGSYQCRAVNSLNESSSTLDLKVNDPGSIIRGSNLSISTLEANSDLMECCKSQNVSPKCLPVCSADGLDIETAFKTPECLSNLDKLMFCAADGSDHRTCCRQRQVPYSCLRWCSGSKLFNIPAICFLSSAIDINQCFQEGRSQLPGPPRNLRAVMASDSESYLAAASGGSSSGSADSGASSTTTTTTMQLMPLMASNSIMMSNSSMAMTFGDSMSSSEHSQAVSGLSSPTTSATSSTTNATSTPMSEPIIIEWDPPLKNAQLVQYYRIFWRPLKSRLLGRSVTNQTWLKLTDLDSSKEYEFVVKAANIHGTSVYSEALTIKPSEIMSKSSHWFMEIGPSQDSLIGRLVMTITFATFFMFSILVVVLFLEKRGYLSRFASSKSNNSRISFANPSYMKDISLDGGADTCSGGDDGSSIGGASSPIEMTSDSRSLSRGSSEGRGSGSSSSNMRFDTITSSERSTPSGDHPTMAVTSMTTTPSGALFSDILELPPIQTPNNNLATRQQQQPSSTTDTTSKTISINNPNYRN